MDRVFHRKPPNIVIQRNTGRKHDIANGRVPRSQEHPALLDFLQIDNPEVYNAVIDWKSAETTLVISHGEAMRIFKERGTVPSNASKAITVQEGSGHFYRFFPPTRGNYSSYSMEKPRGQNRVLVADKQEHVRELQAEREDALRTLNDLKADEDNLKEKRMTLENRRQKNLKKKEFYNSEISQLRQQKTQIKHLLDESAKCKILVSDLKEQQAEKDREKKELDHQISAVFRKNGQIGRAKKELEQRHKNKVNEVEALDDTLQRQQGDEDISREIKTLRAQITQLERKHEQKATKRAKLEWEYKEAKDRFETAENSALEYCNGERLSVTKTAQQIRAEIAEYKKMDEELKKTVGATAAEIMRNKIEAKSSREALENKIAQINHQVLQLTFMKNKRKEGFKIIRNRLGRALKREFAMLMAKHANLLGTLDVNTEHKVLNISVGRTEDNPTDLNVEQNKIPLSSLSGGERSKTLSCFILALWSKQLSPFRALDEWDVFLDDQARTELGNLFIEFGKATDSQYFILSPQTMAITEEMEEGKDEVRKMHKSASASASADN
jgi:chromosome segregation ATPase